MNNRIREIINGFAASSLERGEAPLKLLRSTLESCGLWAETLREVDEDELMDILKEEGSGHIYHGFTRDAGWLKECLGISSVRSELGLSEPSDTCPSIDAGIKEAKSVLEELERENDLYHEAAGEQEEAQDAYNECAEDCPEASKRLDEANEKLDGLRCWDEDIGVIGDILTEAERLRSACENARNTGKDTLNNFYAGLELYKTGNRLLFVGGEISVSDSDEEEVFELEWSGKSPDGQWWMFDFNESLENYKKIRNWADEIREKMERGYEAVLGDLNRSSLELVDVRGDAGRESFSEEFFRSVVDQYAEARDEAGISRY